MSDELPPIEPEPLPLPPDPPSPELSPLQTEPTAGTKFIEAAGRGFLGILAFMLAIAIFGTITAVNRVAGLTTSILAVIGMIMLRKRSGPSTILGAVAIGAAVALVLTGTCAIIILNFS